MALPVEAEALAMALIASVPSLVRLLIASPVVPVADW